ncbi:hypothetical protein BBK36DRAFT_1159095 [Trichoderma citrinoviride]|uniref:Uncharacterized protein n=1 Tax=Trichoderma citrinoviride TaxID=58853 RepID=A0A2T4BD12_9HYPO|nr:hypothetical protein BBK36DRAFT_1159095 [Trichoderma citrinoviride]PTB67158.1 hypothetical protein BBK36DRAFT_1159095 [Trichoderma citrinoviride]
MAQLGIRMEYMEPEGLEDEGTSPDKLGDIVKKLEEWKGFSLALAAVGREKRLEIHDAAHGGLLAWTPLQNSVSDDLLEVPMGDIQVYRVFARACDPVTGAPPHTTPQGNTRGKNRTQTEGDDDADDKWAKDSKATAPPENTSKTTSSQIPPKKVKPSQDEEEDIPGAPLDKSPTTAAQGVEPKSSGKPEGTEHSGYVYSAPLCGLFTYPPELIDELAAFASRHHLDLLPINEMILATHLWMDIQASPNLALETFAETGQSPAPVPNISLACMILLYGHWLKWTHLMQLDEHPHPFRWMQKAFLADFWEEQLGPADLDQEKIKALMEGVGTTVPAMDMSYRVRIFPCCMPGASSGHLHNLAGDEGPSRTALALTGLPDVNLMGLQSYELPTQWIANHQLKTVLWPRSLDNLIPSSPRFEYPEEQAPKTGKPKTMAPTWSSVTGARGCWGFAPMPFPTVPPIPGPVIVKGKKVMAPADYREFLRQTRIHYFKAACFIHARGPCDLTVDLYGRLTPVGMLPLTAADMSMSVPRTFCFSNFAGCRYLGPLRAMEGLWGEWIKEEQKKIQWKSPAGRVDSEAYDELLTLWTAIPQVCHSLWYTGLEQLKFAKREGATTEALLVFLGQCLYWDARDRACIAYMGTRVMNGSIPSGNELSYKLPTALGRCLGIDTGLLPKDTPNLWNEKYVPLAGDKLAGVALDISKLLDHLQEFQGMDLATWPARSREAAILEMRDLWQKVSRGMKKVGAGQDEWLKEWKSLANQYGR